jgi:hypothetical protein
LISDIRTGSIELEDEEIDLEDLDQAYETDLDKEQNQNNQQAQQSQASLAPQPAAGVPNVPPAI